MLREVPMRFMGISGEGPPVAEFDPTPSVNKWLARNRDAGERMRRPHFQRSSLK